MIRDKKYLLSVRMYEVRDAQTYKKSSFTAEKFVCRLENDPTKSLIIQAVLKQ